MLLIVDNKRLYEFNTSRACIFLYILGVFFVSIYPVEHIYSGFSLILHHISPNLLLCNIYNRNGTIPKQAILTLRLLRRGLGMDLL